MRSPKKAEKAALSGEVESQDTQEVLGIYHQQFGVGIWSSSPSQPLPADEVLAELKQHPRPPKVHQKFAGKTSSKQKISASKTRVNTGAKELQVNAKSRGRAKRDPAIVGSCKGVHGKGHGPDGGSSAANRPGGSPGTNLDASNSRASFPSHPTTPARFPKQATSADASAARHQPVLGSQSGVGHVQQRHDDGAIRLTSQTGLLPATVNPARLTAPNDDANDLTSLPAKQPNLRRRKMDPSQSPTQSNDARSYEQYISRGDDVILTDPVEQPELNSQQTSQSADGDRTLQDDDTGAVNFRNIDEYNDNFSALDSLGTGRPSYSSPDRLPRNPETPATHKNPFAGSRAHLLPASQMFGQTQVSSAYKVASPTSSRPSPDIFHPQNGISPNRFISSPLKNLGTGQQQLHAVASSPQISIPYDTSPQHPSHEVVDLTGGLVDSTPVQPKHTFPRGLAEDYEPLYTSQRQYESSPQHVPEIESDSDASEDDEMRRHCQLYSKRAKVEVKLASIKYERRSPPGEAVVPSTHTKRGGDQKTDSQQYRGQCEGRAGDYSQTTVEDSQDRLAIRSGDPGGGDAVIDDSQGVVPRPSEHAAHMSSNDAVVLATLPNTAQSATGSPVENLDGSPRPQPNSRPDTPPGRNTTQEVGTDPVPETSPAMLQPRPFGDMEPSSSGGGSKQESFAALLRSSHPASSSSDNRHAVGPTPSGRRDRSASEARSLAVGHGRAELDASDAASGATRRNSASRRSLDQNLAEVAGTSPVVGSRPTNPALNTRARLRSSRNQGYKMSPPVPGSSGSSLSTLTVTPNISSRTTPLTEGSPDVGADKTLGMTAESLTSSPTAAKAGRSRGKVAAAKPKPHAAASRSLRTSTRRSATSFGRGASVSTDELTRSPASSSPTTFEQSAILSRLGRRSLRETPVSREPSRGGGANLFTGMTFAVSFQAQHRGEKDSDYNSRAGIKLVVENQIKRGGGSVLDGGFDKLFEVVPTKNAEVSSSMAGPDEEIKLTTAAKGTGFTALIADGHSRKEKYMQALALGIPCIHKRWITRCVEKQKLVDWSDYLLCAGSSVYLGDAIKSRSMPVYDAASAKLSEVVETRPRLLRGSRILFVLRKQDENEKMAYVFLTRVLGASVSIVHTVGEARKQLKESEDASGPYDWVYLDERMSGGAALFADKTGSTSTAPAAIRKRKRKSTIEALTPAPKKIRTLSDELVIQSLILGRLIEEDEKIREE
ncbi:hypothetical protein DHEL01_v208202 [Diaporthe helianthi]|uniref:BRCT domain-containing protein n=1 Tax=Diaporthe helianthi TaxID=158607 RepID=A0A2P5HT16_DIAHE|nr:hypothetical protein DHEL01_v208202 [Diaporthe helianthi]